VKEGLVLAERDSGIREALARGGRRVREFRTLNKPYGFGC